MAHVPMSRPDLLSAQYDEQYSTNNTMAYLGGKSILRVAAGKNFMRSDDGGLTWGKPWECTDACAARSPPTTAKSSRSSNRSSTN